MTIESFPESSSILTSSASTVNGTFDVSFSSQASSAVVLNLNSQSSISFPLMNFADRFTVTFIPCAVVEFFIVHVPLDVFFIQSFTVIRSLSLSVAFVTKWNVSPQPPTLGFEYGSERYGNVSIQNEDIP